MLPPSLPAQVKNRSIDNEIEDVLLLHLHILGDANTKVLTMIPKLFLYNVGSLFR
jgi:hypothetical protein